MPAFFPTRWTWAATILGLATALAAFAQRSSVSHRQFAPNVIVPQSRSFAMGRAAVAEIRQVRVGVDILEQVATTTMDIHLRNPSGARIEAELVVPVPDGAAVRSFSYQGASSEPTARLLPRDEARKIYNSIVAKSRDPALLEFVGLNLIRSSVFPVEAYGEQRVRLVYEHLLTAEGDRVDYLLPRSETISSSAAWNVTVRIKSKQPIATAYSPSHALTTTRQSPHALTVTMTEAASREPGPFQLSYLRERGGMAASLLAYPDASGDGGYFLLLAGAPTGSAEKDEAVLKREITLVIDRSGSMSGRKIEQVREAARQVLGGLGEGESFNLLTYNDSVDSVSGASMFVTPETVRRAGDYIAGIKAGGGTNIHAALSEALRRKSADGSLPIMLFLTDGLPTVGETSEAAIRDLVLKSNPYHRRIYTFGVGLDVNTPLLEKIAFETRAAATFVLPGEDVEVKVAQVFKRLKGPVLADTALRVLDSKGAQIAGRVHELFPARLPDLFEDGQLVVLGRYRGNEPLHFELSGNSGRRRRTFNFTFDLKSATVRNAFVPRLWASRKIAMLTDEIRQQGADAAALVRHARTGATPHAAVVNPKLRELVDSIIRLSTEFGILSEYTAFLAREGTDLGRPEAVRAEATRNFRSRAIAVRTGRASINQDRNLAFQKGQSSVNRSNSYVDANLNRVQVTNIRQVADRAFFRRGNRWVDSRLISNAANIKPGKVIEFGSRAFADLMRTLERQGRQSSIALRGDILLEVNGEPVLIKGLAQR